MSVKPEISLAQRKIINGVYVISTACEGRVNAMTASWVSRASFSPPLVSISIGTTRFTHDMIIKSGVFAVNALGEDGKATARRFGLKTGRKTDKFAGVEYATAVTGSPILKDCIAWLDCRVVSHHGAGDHTLFIGEVLDGALLRDEPTVIYDGESFYR